MKREGKRLMIMTARDHRHAGGEQKREHSGRPL
jgi:ribosomal protein L2